MSGKKCTLFFRYCVACCREAYKHDAFFSRFSLFSYFTYINIQNMRLNIKHINKFGRVAKALECLVRQIAMFLCQLVKYISPKNLYSNKNTLGLKSAK